MTLKYWGGSLIIGFRRLRRVYLLKEISLLLIRMFTPSIINFILIQEKGFTESLLNWKTSTGPNSAQLPFLYVITQTLETVNVDLELD